MAEQLSPEKIAQIKDLMKDLDFDPVNQSLIKDNKLIFIYNNQVYRCRMPNQKVQAEAETEQNKKRIGMYKSKDNITRKQLIKLLKENQDVDIESMEKEKKKLRDQLHDVYMDLAVTLSDETSKLEELKIKKNEIESKFMDLTIEVVEWLSPCIEEQVKQVFYGYLAYACTEKNTNREKDVWESAWKSYEEYQEDETGLGFVALQKIQSLILYLSE